MTFEMQKDMMCVCAYTKGEVSWDGEVKSRIRSGHSKLRQQHLKLMTRE